MTMAEPALGPTKLPVRLRDVPHNQLSIQTLADVFSRSGYFADTRDAAQAMVKILFGQELGIPPVTAVMGIHVINGKPTISAHLLASCVRASKRYDYQVRRLDNEACVLEFFDRGQPAGQSAFTMEDATAADATTGPNKVTWRKFPRNMLFARALSNGARWYCPDVGSGGGPVYIPEELGASVDGEGNVIDLPFVPTRERDVGDLARPVQDDAEVEAALGEWIIVAKEADALKIEHKKLPALSPASKIRRWTAALKDKLEQTRAVGIPTETERAAPRDLATGEVLEDGDETPWQRNRRLVKRAQELGLTGIPVLGVRTVQDAIAEANDALAARIENAELDARFSEEA